ncbi:DSBA-like thioredoxin domain protein [compost metagenome]
MLLEAAASVGLDADAARQVLESGRYADEVRAEERQYQQMGIQSVPSVIFNNRYLVTGGQPVEAFEQAIREIAAEAQAGTAP